MKFKEKYTSETLKEKDKYVISDDTYAIGEVISELIEKIDQVTRRLL